MDDETMKALESLREVNEALVTGLEGAHSLYGQPEWGLTVYIHT